MVFASPSKSDELYFKALDFYANNMDQAAVDVLEECILENPTHEKAYIKLGEIVAKNGYYDDAINLYGSALEINPHNIDTIVALLSVAQYYELNDFQQSFKDCFLTYFKSDTHYDLKLGKLWFNVLRVDPSYKEIIGLYEAKSFSAFQKHFESIKDTSALADDFFLSGLRSEIVYSLEFERFLTYLRKHLLLHHDKLQEDMGEDDFTALCEALSCYAFNTEYIFDVSPEENEKIDTLEGEIEAAKQNSLSAPAIALYACYRPAYNLENAKQISETKPGIDILVAKQIESYFAIQRHKKNIPALTAIDDEVSLSVKEQYEEFPYPRWNRFDEKTKHQGMEGHLNKDGTEILIAGCGTGKEAIELAVANPKANILAIDLSLSSLAYAKMKAEALNIGNLVFNHADILKLSDHDKKYDFITSSGVLHHMEDPKKGWSIITDLLKDDGRMRIAMYSSIARRTLTKAQQIIAENEFGKDAQSIRNFRKQAEELMGKKSVAGLTNFLDYFSLSECRDLLFHVQEDHYTCLRLKQEMDDIGLKFDGFYLPSDIFEQYGKNHPNDINQTDLRLWHIFEQKNPETFIGMYKFWCSKK